MATGALTTRSPLRSPARSKTAAWAGKKPHLGAETTVVKPALRQVSTRLSEIFASSAALRQGVAPGRFSGLLVGRGPAPAPGGPALAAVGALRLASSLRVLSCE